MNKTLHVFIFMTMTLFLGAFVTETETGPSFTIDAQSVEERHIFGGLGPSKEPLGSLTEFMVSERVTPLFSIDGMHAQVFPANTAYLFETGDGFEVCPNVRKSGGCYPCLDCKESLEQLSFYDRKNRAHTEKKLVRKFTFSAVEESPAEMTPSPDVPYKGGRVTFHHPEKGGTMTISGQHEMSVKMGEIASRYSDDSTVYLLKSETDATLYICPDDSFTASCMPCLDCAAKEDKIREISR